MEFDSKEALQGYLKEHPKANPSNHTVKSDQKTRKSEPKADTEKRLTEIFAKSSGAEFLKETKGWTPSEKKIWRDLRSREYDEDDWFENEDLSEGLTTDQEQELLYLIHDKGHVMDKGSVKCLDAALKHHKEKSKTPLLRGLYPDEIKSMDLSVGSSITLDRHSSFSENSATAHTFSSSTKTILKIEGASGFNYAKWIQDTLKRQKKEDPDSYAETDNDAILDLARQESEWVLPKGAKYKVKSTQEKDGRTIVTLQPVEEKVAHMASDRPSPIRVAARWASVSSL